MTFDRFAKNTHKLQCDVYLIIIYLGFSIYNHSSTSVRQLISSVGAEPI